MAGSVTAQNRLDFRRRNMFGVLERTENIRYFALQPKFLESKPTQKKTSAI
ncbi:uncharacterized protein RAG0_16430 [Rhynchosporium agropyri]|uniref:Uncharacterized protein n=1 Tax=Rhynchosporium agropyri TaxID=914238 RepID=A0A1E1LQC1_9HELO|nr:uncharacterized protein RAG0_16430 [Rhynchosporium agropyri]